MMKDIKRYGVITVMLLALFGLFKLVSWFWIEDPTQDLQTVLDSNTSARVVIKDRTISVKTDKDTKASYVPSSGHAVVEVHKDDSVDIHVKDKGFDLQLGGGFYYADRFRVGLDTQVFYWNRFSGHVGVGFGSSPVIVPFGLIAYKLDRLRLANTSVGIGYALNKYWVCGLRFEF